MNPPDCIWTSCNFLIRVYFVVARKGNFLYVAVQRGINLQVSLGLRDTLLASRKIYIRKHFRYPFLLARSSYSTQETIA